MTITALNIDALPADADTPPLRKVWPGDGFRLRVIVMFLVASGAAR